jgi:hypothetical protein
MLSFSKFPSFRLFRAGGINSSICQTGDCNATISMHGMGLGGAGWDGMGWVGKYAWERSRMGRAYMGKKYDVKCMHGKGMCVRG